MGTRGMHRLGLTALAVCGVVATFPALAFGAGGDFFQPSTSPETAGDASRAIETADFDGDGEADLAIGNNEDTNTVTLLKGDGAGDFAPFASSPLAMGASLAAWDVIATDVDNDDDEDLVVADGATTAGESDVGIFLNNGNATFAAPLVEDLGTAGWPRIVRAANINGDAYIDLVVGNFFGTTVTVLLNDGDESIVPDGIGEGDFTATAGSPIPATGGGGTNLTALAVGNIDNNGTTDFVVGKEFTDKIQVFTNNGSGIFAALPEQTFPGLDPGDIEIGNFNGGLNDIAVANGSSSSVSILNGVGDGTFTQVAGSPVSIGTSPGGSTANQVVSEELSGDTNEDLAVAIGFNTAASRLAILLGNGAGGFSAAPTSPELPASAAFGPNIPFGLTAGQFNGGNLDLANSNISPQPATPVNIWLNDGPGVTPGGGGGTTTTPQPIPLTPPSAAEPPKKCKKGQKLKKGKCVKKGKKKK